MSGQSMMGGPGESSLSFHGGMAGLMGLLIYFYTDILVQRLIATGSEVDTLLILIIVTFLWLILRNGIEAAVTTTFGTAKTLPSVRREAGGSMAPPPPPNSTLYEDYGWSESWLSFMGFVARILVILLFRYAAVLLLAEWTLTGVTINETIALLVLLAIFFFPAYQWVERMWEAHHQREMAESARRALATARGS